MRSGVAALRPRDAAFNWIKPCPLFVLGVLAVDGRLSAPYRSSVANVTKSAAAIDLDVLVEYPGYLDLHGNVAPGAGRQAVHVVALGEWFATRREDLAETGGKRTREHEAAERRKTERRAKCTTERVTRMEEAFGWVLAHVADVDRRKVLLAYAEVKARGWQWERYLQNRNRRNPTNNAWVKRTVQRWIILSLQSIAENIPKTSTLLPMDPDLLLAQIEGESTGKSIRSDLRSWMAPDGKPSYRRTA